MANDIRDVLFGDMPIAEWPAEPLQDEPWRSFVDARTYIGTDNVQGAVESLQRVLAMPDLESRQYLQAWTFLRALEVEPPDDEAKYLYGVIVEVGMEEGLDIVAAYADHSARYINYTGKAIIWERPNGSLDATVDALLDAGRTVVAQIGPWDDARPAPPPVGQVRINLLTPSGLHFGQGPFDLLYGDRMGGPVISGAIQLMQALIAVTEQG